MNGWGVSGRHERPLGVVKEAQNSLFLHGYLNSTVLVFPLSGRREGLTFFMKDLVIVDRDESL